MMLRGAAAAPGIAIGKARVRAAGYVPVGDTQPASPVVELARLDRALELSRVQLREIAGSIRCKAGEREAAIFRVHAQMLDDALLLGAFRSAVEREACRAERAVQQAVDELARQFEALGDPVFQERAVDLKDIGQRVLRNLSPPAEPRECAAGILICAEVTPSGVTAEAAAIVTAKGGATGHAAILARALGIAAVMGVPDILARVREGDTVVVDGGRGEVVINPEAGTLEEYRLRQSREAAARERSARLRNLPAVTLDGRRVELAANIAAPGDVPAALAAGAESVGVLRTEFLFLGRAEMPSEQEQFEAYREIVAAMAPRRVVIRTLDLGGDKNLPYCEVPAEENPALGLRGIRLCLEYRPMLAAQLRAIARAAECGNVAVLLPMITDLAEVREARALLGARLPLGVMVETPAAAIMAGDLAREADFLSIGTNDLVQYVLAADRLSQRAARWYQPFHPAVLRLVAAVCDAARREGKPAAVCGEMAADPDAAVLFTGMGVDELSMTPAAIPAVKDAIRRVRRDDAARLARELLALASAREIERCLRERAARLPAPEPA
ncbi:MAG: phosphoenolpyruvate--protein phosphotransferase [Bryobacteraceae bacterium]